MRSTTHVMINVPILQATYIIHRHREANCVYYAPVRTLDTRGWHRSACTITSLFHKYIECARNRCLNPSEENVHRRRPDWSPMSDWRPIWPMTVEGFSDLDSLSGAIYRWSDAVGLVGRVAPAGRIVFGTDREPARMLRRRRPTACWAERAGEPFTPSTNTRFYHQWCHRTRTTCIVWSNSWVRNCALSLDEKSFPLRGLHAPE